MARIYLRPGQQPPKGVMVHKGKNGGSWYESSGRRAAGKQPADENATPSISSSTAMHALEKFERVPESDKVHSKTGEKLTAIKNPLFTGSMPKGNITGNVKREQVSVDSLASPQKVVFVEGVKEYLSKKHFDKPIVVYKIDGKYFVIEGNHRAVAAKLLGVKKIPAEVIELESIENFKQAGISSSEDLPKIVAAQLGGEAGFIAARDEAFAEFAGLSSKAAEAVRNEIIELLRQPQGWSTTSVTERIKHHWEAAGFPPVEAAARASLVARTEIRSIASEFKRRAWREEEKDRGKEFRYHIRGADDHRTTKLSFWTRQQVPVDGLTLDQMEKMLDQGVEYARAGVFREGGALSSVRGQPIVLPKDFRRRGFLIHFNDRDQVFRMA